MNREIAEKPKGNWDAEDYRRANDVHESAERIIRRVVANVLGLAHARHNLDELVEEKWLVDDGIAVALGEDSGCLDPDSLSPENCEVLYLEKELWGIIERACEKTAKIETPEDFAKRLYALFSLGDHVRLPNTFTAVLANQVAIRDQALGQCSECGKPFIAPAPASVPPKPTLHSIVTRLVEILANPIQDGGCGLGDSKLVELLRELRASHK